MREVSETSAAQEVSVPASGRETFWRLVRSYEYEPDRRAKILEEIDRLFRRPATILVVDACGFTRASRGTGIVQFLALLRRLEGIVIPEVERAGGSMLAREADNFFALMPAPAAALECGRAILSEVARSNGGLPADKRLAVSIGIGHGDVLMVERGLMYGDEMNLVCKVGEDLARPGRDPAHARGPRGARLRPRGFRRAPTDHLGARRHRLPAARVARRSTAAGRGRTGAQPRNRTSAPSDS